MLSALPGLVPVAPAAAAMQHGFRAEQETKPAPTLVETSRNHRVSLYVLKP